MSDPFLRTQEALIAMGFSAKDGRTFILAGQYLITVQVDPTDVSSSTIDFGSDIKVHHKGASNFSRPENLVVLECVVRLLKKGYAAGSIELEKNWKLGHKGKGRLDVLVRKKKKTFAMIECKTWGEKHLKERDNILEDGGQLFSYLVQERTTAVLVLYSSKFESGKIRFRAEAIETAKLNGANSEELHKSWDRSFIQESIFHDEAAPYFSSKRNLKKTDLQELDRDSGRGLFNSFAEILRRHVISDKSNAFNKIFNLFVCKIYDEDTKKPSDELEFQWKVSDSFSTLIERLSGLYMRGLKDYLSIDITPAFFSANAEFGFIDVFDKQSYEKNFTVVKEVVELLQSFQIKYTSKHQFLGDFFERLLNTGIKQEAGQFFTPIPLARFFLKSLPIDEMISANIANKSPNVLPFVLDYACGSGHFLTEAIDEIEEHIAHIDVSSLVGRTQINFLSIKENFYWAKDHIYGIERDYRLAKTTKIALFLHGDGDAIIVNGDGLDDFYRSDSYEGLLKTRNQGRQNEHFDMIVSNPPFSIAGFKQYVVNGKANFALYPYVTPKSTEIECLFFERLLHLLRENGCAGVILPLSVINSDVGVYVAARRLLLIDFDLNGLVELRDKTFSATGTTTVGVFVRKRPRKIIENALAAIKNYFVDGKENPTISKLIVDELHKFSLAEDEVRAEVIQYFTNTSQTLDTLSMPLSITFLMVLLLNLDRSTVIAYSGEKKEQEHFLGYRFSSSRGKEGIEFLYENGILKTELYDPNDNCNPSKVNTHIRASFLGNRKQVPEPLEKRLRYVQSSELLDGKTLQIKNPSSFFESEHLALTSNSRFGDLIDNFDQTEYQLPKLIQQKLISVIDGLTYNKSANEVPRKTSNKVLTASNLILETGRLDLSKKLIYLREGFVIPEELKPKEGDIIISKASGSLKHLGKCVYVEECVDAAVGGFLMILRSQDKKLGKALFYRLLSARFRQFVSSLRDQNINNMSIGDLEKFRFMLPTDLDAFYDLIIEKENQLKAVEDELRKLST